ncbi:hypothetical protein [Cytobacillus firmus]|uniref:DUF2642 domain-containing protein n=1 Tax=Cytobacillus firmus TaxID=1399 RepID=A0AA46SJK0_CYTFI|nr:hypothetical protein [Cytobacillus firmus]KML43628.1 hypothetical protein VL14_06120 [Cytobacillus firmus]UYG96247.1 DUF2642 domain-containing protein [Cytobacillus firmus]
MKKLLSNSIGEKLKLKISGKKAVTGILIDIGSDILVLFDGKDYLYIPTAHVHDMHVLETDEITINPPNESPNFEHQDSLSLRKILNSSKGMFIEIYTSGNQALHGYVTSIMNNYFVFYSPVYKTMLISLYHLKWLIPYVSDLRPYGLGNEKLPLIPANISLARSLEVQIEKMAGELIIINLGEYYQAIGKVASLENNFIELVTAKQDNIFINMQHVKTIHFANK